MQALRTMIELIRDVRTCRTPAELYDFQRRLFHLVIEVEQRRAALLTLFVLAAIGFAWTSAGCDRPRAYRTARLLLLGNGCANLTLLCGSLILWGLLRP